MTLPTIKYSTSLTTVWEELCYLESRISRQALTRTRLKQALTTIGTLITRTNTVREGQLQAWRRELSAQAWVDDAQEALAGWIEDVSDELLRVAKKDRKSPRVTRYFAKRPSAIIRLGLENQLPKVRTWPASLQGESEKELKSLGKSGTDLVTDGDHALAERSAAASATADHRAQQIVPLIDAVNTLRQTVYGDLVKIAAENKKGQRWARNMFLRDTRSAARASAPADSPPTAAPAATPTAA